MKRQSKKQTKAHTILAIPFDNTILIEQLKCVWLSCTERSTHKTNFPTQCSEALKHGCVMKTKSLMYASTSVLFIDPFSKPTIVLPIGVSWNCSTRAYPVSSANTYYDSTDNYNIMICSNITPVRMLMNSNMLLNIYTYTHPCMYLCTHACKHIYVWY